MSKYVTKILLWLFVINLGIAFGNSTNTLRTQGKRALSVSRSHTMSRLRAKRRR